jgi:VWFA-related protein
MRFHPSPIVLAAAVSVAVAMPSAGVQAQQVPTFSATTRLVTVAVSVMDRRTGAPVEGLTRADFEVLSDGRPADIVQFSNTTGPVTVALLLDASGSMAVNRALPPAAAAAAELLGDMRDADRAGIFTFDNALIARTTFDTVGPGHTRALAELKAFGSTSLYDAVLATSQAAAADASPRRGVIVFTDGVDTSSIRRPEDVRTRVAGIDVPLYIVVVTSPLGDAHPLTLLANDTGGRLFAVGGRTSTTMVREQILTDLRRHYLLAIAPDTRAGWHPLTVRTTGAHTVRARAGYIVTPQGGTSCVACF